MFESVAAVRFDRRMTTGRTWPCLLTCERANGEEIEVIAKFSAGCDRRVNSLVAEAISAMLAADLGLPIPEPVAVEYDDNFVVLVEMVNMEVAQRLRQSVPIAFGSVKLPPGFSQVFPKLNTEPLRSNAAEIFAFDALIQNPDRRPENQNCLYNDPNFAIFDHELCFVTEGIIGYRPPWELGALDSMRNRHVFYSGLSGSILNLDRLKTAWQTITDARLHQYRQALPIEWTTDFVETNNMLSYLASVRDNIESALTEVMRVLS